MEFIKKNPIIYVLSGKAHTGKNTIAKIIKEVYNKKDIKTVNIAYASYLKEYAKNILDWDGSEETKPREFLQQLGVELIKNKINERLLINRVLEDIEVYSYFFDIITITDARLESEINSLKDNFDKVITMHIYRTEDNILTNKQKKHLTEIGLDNYHDYDYEICNDGSLEELESNIESIIKEVEENE